MSLTDLMSSFDLSIYPQVAMVLFVGVFVIVASRMIGRKARAASAEAAMLPFQDDTHAEGGDA